MGTRSIIGVMHGDKCKLVYCHWDGYLAGVGATLLEHYDSAKANHLVSLGNLSSLGVEIKIPKDAKHSFDKPIKGITVFYNRDRGEKDQEFNVRDTFESFLDHCNATGAEYYYIMNDGVWYCGNMYPGSALNEKLVPLATAIAAEKLVA